MKLSEITTKNVTFISPATNVSEAAKKMCEHDIGALPILDGDSLQGILTDRDITVRVVAAGKDPQRTQVKDIMTKAVVTSKATESVEDTITTMGDKQLRRVAVVDDNNKLYGMVSLADVVCKTDDSKLIANVFRKVCAPTNNKNKEQHKAIENTNVM